MLKALHKIITEYNSGFVKSPSRSENLELLSDPTVKIVITGQQCGLFGGPLLTFYKALGAIKRARELREKGFKAVPLFWVQSEDHDFEEVAASFHLNSSGELVELKLEPDIAKNKVSVEYIKLGAEVETLFEKLSAQYSTTQYWPQISSLFRSNYTKDHTFSESFAGFMAALFAEEGLVLFNPRTPGTAQLMAPIYKRAYASWREISAALIAQSELLQSQGEAPQVHIREDSPLFFYHSEGSAGPRYRLTAKGSDWGLIGAADTVTSAELQALLENDPTRFSNSALLRPIVQDYLFAPESYIGGQAELNYFKQIRAIYRYFEVPQPNPVARPSYLLVEPKHKKNLDELGISASDLSRTEEELKNILVDKFSTKYQSPTQIEKDFSEMIDSIFATVRTNYLSADSSLANNIDKTEIKLKEIFSALNQRYLQAITVREKTQFDKLFRVRTALYPNGEPQERILGLPYYLARYGIELKRRLLGATLNKELAQEIVLL